MAEKPEVVPDDNNNLEEPQTPITPVDETILTVEQLSQKVKELEENLTKEKADKIGIIEQLKEVRKAKQEAEAKGFVQFEPTQPSADPTEQKVKDVLRQEREAEAKDNRVIALRKFQEKHPEFNPENDISGIKIDAVHNSLKRIKSSAYAVDDILQDYEDALKLMKKDEKTTTQINSNQFASTPSSIPTNPLETVKNPLTPEQEKLRKEKGWTIEKYLKMKAKHPMLIP